MIGLIFENRDLNIQKLDSVLMGSGLSFLTSIRWRIPSNPFGIRFGIVTNYWGFGIRDLIHHKTTMLWIPNIWIPNKQFGIRLRYCDFVYSGYGYSASKGSESITWDWDLWDRYLDIRDLNLKQNLQSHVYRFQDTGYVYEYRMIGLVFGFDKLKT